MEDEILNAMIREIEECGNIVAATLRTRCARKAEENAKLRREIDQLKAAIVDLTKRIPIGEEKDNAVNT